MIALRPLGDAEPYAIITLGDAAGGERAVPAEWLDDGDMTVTQAFIDYVRPIVGPLVEYDVPLKDRLPRAAAAE